MDEFQPGDRVRLRKPYKRLSTFIPPAGEKRPTLVHYFGTVVDVSDVLFKINERTGQQPWLLVDLDPAENSVGDVYKNQNYLVWMFDHELEKLVS